MLEARRISAGYLDEDIIHEVSLDVGEGEAVAIIGSNGAGKTTLLRVLAGLLEPSAGVVRLAGDDITHWAAHRRARAGLAYVPTERRLFPFMTAKDNLALGSYPRRIERARLDFVLDLFPLLADRLQQPAGSLSGGEQQMVAIGRALMSRPRVLVLDEPTTGLSPKLGHAAYQALRTLQGEGLTLLLAEQQVPLALRLADRGYVLENGRVQLSSAARDLAANPAVRRAYLGVA